MTIQGEEEEKKKRREDSVGVASVKRSREKKRRKQGGCCARSYLASGGMRMLVRIAGRDARRMQWEFLYFTLGI